MSNLIKPCPFCQSEKIHKVSSYTDLYFHVVCSSCGSEGPKKGNIVDAIELWNNVARTEEHLKDRIEQLKREKDLLYDRCLENEEAMYEAVKKGNDNHLIDLVEEKVNK